MPAPLDAALTDVRGRLGASIMRMVAGAEPSPPRGLGADDTDRRFPAGSPISTVHGDASMFVGGLSALLLQALHPLAMAGVADHSDYRDRPVGRLARTSHFLALTTFGTVEEADAAVAAVRAVHRRVRGVAPDGRPYAASDPHLVEWVHVAEVASFLRAHRRYGASRLDPAGRGPLRRPGRRDRPRARGAVRAGDGRRAAGRRWTGSAPSWRARRPPATSPATSCWSRRWPDRPGPPTRRSPPPPSPCCRAGPGGPCGCRGCRSPRRPSCRAGGEAITRTIRWSLGGRQCDAVLRRAGTGSSWPRAHRARRELLGQLGVAFTVRAADVDETPSAGERPRDLVARLAAAKAAAVDGPVVLAADTIVEVDGEILGKPVDAADARRMLGRLSGRTHHVHTGVAVRAGERVEVEVVTTAVTFVPLVRAAVDWYVATGEPFDKAGAYAVQGAGGVFVESIRGSVSNVVGLPLSTTVDLLRRVTGWSPFDDPSPLG